MVRFEPLWIVGVAKLPRCLARPRRADTRLAAQVQPFNGTVLLCPLSRVDDPSQFRTSDEPSIVSAPSKPRQWAKWQPCVGGGNSVASLECCLPVRGARRHMQFTT